MYCNTSQRWKKKRVHHSGYYFLIIFVLVKCLEASTQIHITKNFTKLFVLWCCYMLSALPSSSLSIFFRRCCCCCWTNDMHIAHIHNLHTAYNRVEVINSEWGNFSAYCVWVCYQRTIICFLLSFVKETKKNIHKSRSYTYTKHSISSLAGLITIRIKNGFSYGRVSIMRMHANNHLFAESGWTCAFRNSFSPSVTLSLLCSLCVSLSRPHKNWR